MVNIIKVLSLSKNNVGVLFLEGVHDSASSLMEESGYPVRRLPGSPIGDTLSTALQGVHILGIRSRTGLGFQELTAADRLMAVGCFCIGTNQVDLAAARSLGIPVFNAPFSNTRSVAELVVGEIVMLMRRIFPKSALAHSGAWDKAADGCHEVRGKTLGIVGYGNIGTQLSTLAEAMGMKVIYFDVADKLRHGNTEATGSLSDLLSISDVVSLHVPENASTSGMFGSNEIASMRRGTYLINNSRGSVVDVSALAAALASGHLAGAAVDVFPSEPRTNSEEFMSPLRGLTNVILTPHVGGSTVEAQERIGREVARKLVDYSDTGSTAGAVNFPQVLLPARHRGTRFIHVHRNVPGVLNAVNGVFSAKGANIAAQYLETDADIGYLVVEAEASHGNNSAILEGLRAVPGTVRVRLVHEASQVS